MTLSRINDFLGTDSEYITYLESIVRRCIPTHAFPSPPPSVIRSFEAYNDCDTENPIQFISYEPEPDVPPAKRQRTKPRWELEMDSMLHNLNASDWSLERKKVGLASTAEILNAFDKVIGAEPPMEPADVSNTVVRYAPSDVLQLLDTFGSATAALKVGKTFARQIYRFHKFVFVSTCSVALHHGVNKNEVNAILRRHISCTEWKNLNRLRSGVRWGNRMMNALAADGFGHMAYEYFVVHGQSLAQYGRFAHAGEHGFSYFRSRVPKRKLELEIQASLPFWIPFIIKARMGDVYSLAAICLALGYDADSHTHSYSQYVDNYHNRRMPLLAESGAVSGHGQVNGNVESNSMDTLLTAAETLAESVVYFAQIVAVNKLEDILGVYLFDGVRKCHKWQEERGTRWVKFTDTVRLHFARTTGDDFNLEICVCSLIGTAILEARLESVEGLKNMLGDYLFEGMKTSNLRKQEEEAGLSHYTNAVTEYFPTDDDDSDCTVEVKLDFEIGLLVWAELYPN